MDAIRAAGLTKRFGNVTAVNNLDLSIPSGELYSLLGVNGAGKTTTLRMLSGLLRPDSGDIQICGKNMATDSAGAKALLAISPQESATARNLTVRENLEMIGGIYGMRRAKRNMRVPYLIEALGLTEVASRRSGTLSGGYQRRLSIAMALVSEPKVLFLDEPTLGLDVLARRALWDFIRDLHGKMTVILTTHAMDEAQALSDRIGMMSDGRLIGSASAEDWMRQTGTVSLEQAFLCTVSGEART